MTETDISLKYFSGFEKLRIDTSETTINGVKGGDGPPLLLLHGYPQSHLEWHKVATNLAKDFTVVATDLRGYGKSGKPESDADHAAYSKRALAQDQVEVMQQLNFDRYAVVGHDRGGRVGHRMALDHGDKVTKLAVIDIVPTHTLYTNVTREFATLYFHWFFLIQAAPMPETLLLNSADFFLGERTFRGMVPKLMPQDIFNEYLSSFKDPDTQHAMCEDYRASTGIDMDHDAADLDKKIQCPLLAVWGEKGPMHLLYDVIDTWKEKAKNVSGKALPGGHWLPEELPNETSNELRKFLIA